MKPHRKHPRRKQPAGAHITGKGRREKKQIAGPETHRQAKPKPKSNFKQMQTSLQGLQYTQIHTSMITSGSVQQKITSVVSYTWK
jgi:hypothetical protein